MLMSEVHPLHTSSKTAESELSKREGREGREDKPAEEEGRIIVL
jgi:hypothetical protein